MAKEKTVLLPKMNAALTPLTDETGAAIRMGDYISVMEKDGIGRKEYRIVAVTESGRAAVAIGEGFSSMQIPIDNSMRKRIRRLTESKTGFFGVYG